MALGALERPRLVRRAIWLEAAVIAYNLLEGVAAIIAGLIAGSVALVGFGLDSAIEVSASTAVVAHLWMNREEKAEAWERRVAVFVGVTLLALAAYVGGRAIFNLATAARPEESYLGIAIAIFSLVVI
jgi:divalent metal cation (Fe/Co/Zn/Cd) transporter